MTIGPAYGDIGARLGVSESNRWAGAPRLLNEQYAVVTARDEMNRALRHAIDVHLRPAGFKGSLPHLRRCLDERIDLVSFQFFSAGGSFVVEVASCGPDGMTWAGRHIPPSSASAQYIGPPNRPRLGSPAFPDFGDHWFVFGPRNYEPGFDHVESTKHYEAVASDVMRLIAEQAEPFWASYSHERSWPSDRQG